AEGPEHASGHPHAAGHPQGHGCPGSQFMKLTRDDDLPEINSQAADSQAVAPNMSGYHMGGSQIPDMGGMGSAVRPVSRLAQWPCQIKLLPTEAPFYDGAKLLIAADCTAYAYANMHEDFMKGKVTLIGCPKLDTIDYSEKLTEIISRNDIKGVTIVRMEVPCCGGLQRAAEKALRVSGKFIPWQVVIISRDGKILE
ncbi:MAG: ferredoxin, partial [Lachnospiraceae bacterium]